MGHPKPVPILDPLLNIFLPIRANGQFGFRVVDSRKLVVQLVGTVGTMSRDDISNYFRGVILTKTKDYIAGQLIERRLSILTVTSCLDEMSKALQQKLSADFALYGLEIANFFINSIDVPEDDPEVQHVKQAMANKAEMRILGEDAYKMKRTFDVLESAAKNDGGGNMMGAGLGLGMGMGAGNGFAGLTAGAMGSIQPSAKPALPAPSDMVVCQACGNKSFSAFKFCTICGAALITPNAVCPTCGMEVPVGAKFCGHCGIKMGIDVCPFCKHPVPPGAQACPNCSSKMGAKQ
jgi:membrane protease subunit (stomatin/prohibitin family)